MKKRFIFLNMAIVCFCIVVFIFYSKAAASGKDFKILASTFPIRQLALNIINGRKNVDVELLIPAQFGCPHDYALTPQDMQKLAKADVLIINGFGMEEFLGAPVQKANSSLKIIDSSIGIKDILFYSDGDHHDIHTNKGNESKNDHQHHDGVNPHLFASPRMAGLLAINIAGELSRIDPSGAAIYSANAHSYAKKMNKLADDFSALGKRIKNNRIVTQHGVFDYLSRDMGLNVVAVVQEHAGQEPSAAQILKIVKTIRQQNAKAIFTEPQYPKKIGKTIAKEAGIVNEILDPVATGPENVSLDYYETIMLNNL
ncbi:MAG: metal ABC transporter substrate-binding protein, partial [Proteobacteria bacterium]|nr:metal ABC transporter substrate-binding protein [Pseudomonadota bacterium]